MDAIVVTAYTVFGVATIAVLYSILLVVEVKKGVRFFESFRRRLDRRVVALISVVSRNAGSVSSLYERGSHEVEKDLIDPLTKPIVETQQRYTEMKTGEREIRHVGKSNISPHLRKLLSPSGRKKKSGGSKKANKRPAKKASKSENQSNSKKNPQNGSHDGTQNETKSEDQSENQV